MSIRLGTDEAEAPTSINLAEMTGMHEFQANAISITSWQRNERRFGLSRDW